MAQITQRKRPRRNVLANKDGLAPLAESGAAATLMSGLPFLMSNCVHERYLTILLAPTLETRGTRLKNGLDIHHSELATLAFLMRGHGPKKRDAMARHGDV